MTQRVLATALLTAGLCAQGTSLVYDNGSFETSPGFSNLNTSTGHTVPGYGGQLTATVNNSLYDEFVVATSMVVEEVELFCYQTGVPNGTSTINGIYLAFYDTDPSLGSATMVGAPMAGSPAPTVNMFTTPNNPVSNSWSGVYRELNGDQATNRAIIAVRVRLEDAAGTATPLVLTPGTYWLRMQASGSGVSGPWFPPITCPQQAVTGNAMQFIGIPPRFWNNPVLSGNAGAQGMPFLLFGQSASPGSIAQVATGCGGTGITVCGAPTLGGFVRSQLTLTSSMTVPVIGYGFSAPTQQYCGCTFMHAFPIAVWGVTSHVLHVPLSASFAGVRIDIQGVEFGAVGGCAQHGGFTVTDGYALVVNM